MKQSVFYFFMLSAASMAVAQDTIPNPGFENWITATYENPNEWSTLNPLTSGLNKITAFKTSSPSEVHSGSHAIKLVSKFIIPSNFAPAFVTTGTVNADPDSGGIIGGIPINSRPTAVTGWYRYFPIANDKALFEVSLFKQGTEIGSGSVNAEDSVSTWTGFTVPITYTSSETPDTVLISLFASEGNASPPSEENSTLFLDDISYSYSTSIENVEDAGVLRILPNPTSEKIVVESNDRNVEYYIIHALDGRKVKEVSAKDNIVEIKVDDLKAGKYILSAVKDKGKTFSEVFEIQR